MKYFLLLLVWFAAPAVGQDSVRLARKEHRAEIRQEMLSLPRSQVRLGVAPAPMMFGLRSVPEGQSWKYNPALPAITAEYGYRVVDFLELGLAATYARPTRQAFFEVGQEVGVYTQDVLNLTLLVRYAWFNRPWVSLYSSFGVGCMIAFGNYKSYGQNNPSAAKAYFMLDAAPLGVRVGKRFFGYVEPFCWGARGMFIQGGFGYKF